MDCFEEDRCQNLTLSTVGNVEDSFEGDLCQNLTLSSVGKVEEPASLP